MIYLLLVLPKNESVPFKMPCLDENVIYTQVTRSNALRSWRAKKSFFWFQLVFTPRSLTLHNSVVDHLHLVALIVYIVIILFKAWRTIVDDFKVFLKNVGTRLVITIMIKFPTVNVITY